jgi:hypothetical protein
MNWGIALLAYGKQHIDEFNITAKRIREIDKLVPIWVGTDSPDSIDSELNCITIPINEEFNYNLKRIPITEALKNVDTVWYCDTDIYIRNGIDFSIMDGRLSTGIYPRWIKPESELADITGSFEYIQNYLESLHSIINQSLHLILEENFIIRKGDGVDEFLSNWKRIDEQTREVQHQQYELNGASEGLIIWVSAQLANFPICNKPYLDFWNDVIHFGREWQKANKTIL